MDPCNSGNYPPPYSYSTTYPQVEANQQVLEREWAATNESKGGIGLGGILLILGIIFWAVGATCYGANSPMAITGKVLVGGVIALALVAICCIPSSPRYRQ